ncbi:hypothetical protein PVK06_004721 [Gossypium arboreum]|uniref:Uncharacterized protein n=1 Tax=Gossypium arboreum TaxID=29729 RepID=A0ABR0QU09_GOSAR|nr:hypothetical protein PVK06_004721 [Gossypium arboreum]
MNSLFHNDKVRSTSTFDPGIDSACPFNFINYGVRNPFSFRKGDTLRSASCFSPTFQVSSSKELRLYYLSEERRFTLTKKSTVQIDSHPFIHMGKQGDNVRWCPLKEGGPANNLICDLDKFLLSKWPDLRINHLQEGGYDAILVASR